MNNPIRNQTCKEFMNIARAEHVPYSRTNKAALAARVQEYRDTVERCIARRGK